MVRRFVSISGLLLASSLTGCLGVGPASVGGNLSGLPASTTVTLQNNGGDNLSLSQNGSFTFSGTLDKGKTYSVTVSAQPAGATCTVANGTGTIDSEGGDVTNVSVTCVSSGSLSGTISGLLPGTFVTLLNNGGSPLPVTANGGFAFPGILSNGTAYAVTVQLPLPSGLTTCNVSNGSGNLVTGTPTNVVVACS